MATPGKVGRVLTQSSATPVAFTDEAATANAAYTRYTIIDSDKRYWDKNTAPTVKKNGATVTSGYSVEYPGGVIVFDSALLASDIVTISGKYVVVEQLAGFFNWSLTVNNKTIDATCYESGEWDEFVMGTKNFSVTAEKFFANSEDFSQRIGEEMIVVLYADFGTVKTRFEGYATVSGDDVSSAVGEIVKDKLSFQGTQGVYFRTGNETPILIAYDSFDRADNAASLGNADTGETWVTLSGTPRIISNQASATTGIYRGYIESEITDCVLSAKIVDVGTEGAALMFRLVDVNNRYYVGVYPTSLVLGKFVAGTQTVINTVALAFVDNEILSITVDGTAIKVYVNGTKQIDTTDSDLTVGTKCGIGIGANDDYLDNFKIETI